MIEQFHFLRPVWLLLLVPLVYFFWLLLRARYDSGNWRTVIDASLQPFVLSRGAGSRRSLLRWLLWSAALLAVLALAGPVWERLPQPVYHKNASIVIALDLSLSMNAADIKPSRIARARHKIADILNLKGEGQSALVVYAADAFTVTPLTTDGDTILAMLPGLDSELMPAQGTRADRAIELAFELLANAGVARGDVLLVSDGLDDIELENIQRLHREHGGHRLSVLAVGSAEGGPIPLDKGGFLKDRNGAIVIASLGEDNLRSLARSGDGVYATLAADDIDINSIAYLFETSIDEREASLSDRSADIWRELGPWLVLLSLPLVALAFRRGVVMTLPLLTLLLPPSADAADWDSLWLNRDQRAADAFEQQRYRESAELFDDETWRAAARYRAGDYDGALEIWQRQDSDAALFNSANALTRMGRLDDALAKLDKLLERSPNDADARRNREIIEAMRQRQPQGSGQGQSQDGADGEKQQSDEDSGTQSGEPQQQADSADPGEAQNEAGSRESDEPRQAQSEKSPSVQEDAVETSEEETAQSPTEPQDQLARVDRQMSEQAVEQWLRKIPDDPGGLLRRKFLYQYRKRGGVDTEAQPW